MLVKSIQGLEASNRVSRLVSGPSRVAPFVVPPPTWMCLRPSISVSSRKRARHWTVAACGGRRWKQTRLVFRRRPVARRLLPRGRPTATELVHADNSMWPAGGWTGLGEVVVGGEERAIAQTHRKWVNLHDDEAIRRCCLSL